MVLRWLAAQGGLKANRGPGDRLMAKRKSVAKISDKDLARRLFPKSVRKELKTALAALDGKPKRKAVKKR